MFSIVEIEDLSEAVNCWTAARKTLLTQGYGLSESRFLPSEYRRLVSHQYFHVLRNKTPIAVLRIIPNIPMAQYSYNLVSEVRSVLPDTNFFDLGLYYLVDVSSEERMEIVRKVIDFARKKSLKVTKKASLYIQVPPQHANYYAMLGFKVAGAPFQQPGWRTLYLPMYLGLSVQSQPSELQRSTI